MSATEPFVVVDVIDEIAPPLLPPPPIVRDEDLVLHTLLMSGDAVRVAARFNSELPEFIGGILNIEFNGLHSVVALIRAPKWQIDLAKKEGRL